MKSFLIVLAAACLGGLPPAFASSERVAVSLDTTEAERVLAILAKTRHSQPVAEEDWQALFATEPYRRLKTREAAMHRDFSDDDFRKFVLSSEMLSQYDDLSRTLEVWKKADLRAAGVRVLQYLPAQAVIRVKVFPEIKPKHNSFVFDVATDPAIFLYLDPKVSQREFDNTVSHEMHHIGLSSTDKLYEKKIEALPEGPRKAARWIGAFGEGMAVLAAAGGPDVPANQFSRPDVRENWERGMRTFSQDLETLNEFFLAVSDGRLKDEAVNEKASSFFGEIQGPWYTVGYRMAVLVEKRYGRAALVECMLDPRLLLKRYNQAAEEHNAHSPEKLALWSPAMLKAMGRE